MDRKQRIETSIRQKYCAGKKKVQEKVVSLFQESIVKVVTAAATAVDIVLTSS